MLCAMARLTKVTIDSRITVDASLTEKHSSSIEVTKHPVESGAKPADHSTENPDKVIIEGIFSNTPTSEKDWQKRGTGGMKPGAVGYAQNMEVELRQLLSDRKLTTLDTDLRYYDSMMLIALDVPRDSKTGDAIRFTATFERVRFVELKSVTLAPVPKPVDPKQPSKKTKQGKKTSTERPETKSTLLKQTTDWAGATMPGSGL
jgi:hypothetical protein